MIANPKREILYVSNPYDGSRHDYAMLKDEFDPQEAIWFDEQGIYVDLGFLGIAKDYEIDKLHIPFKRPRRKTKKDPRLELSEEQKTHNKSVSKNRIRVEHAIGGLKRYRYLSDRLRCKDKDFYARVVGVAAGLWNFQLNN